MRKLLAVLYELLWGLPLIAIGLLFARTALQSRSLAYAIFPALSIAALLLGAWRSRRSALPPWLTVTVLGLPLVLALVPLLSERNPLLPVIPALAFVALALGAWCAAAVPSPGRRTAWLAGVALLLNVAGAFFLPVFVRSFIVSERVRSPVPPFRMTLLDGGEVSLAALRGRIVVLDFWATWCIPCRREMPELEAARRRFASSPEVVFYAVDLAHGDTPDQPGDSPAQASAFLRAGGYGLVGAYDGAGEAQRALGPNRLPALFVLDRSGQVRFRHLGFVGAEDLSAGLGGVLETLLAEPAGGPPAT
jgi:thiol-disulfide isomerase/thioredoxin